MGGSWQGNPAAEEPQAFDAYKLACRVNANGLRAGKASS